jgi:hypothetical protein
MVKHIGWRAYVVGKRVVNVAPAYYMGHTGMRTGQRMAELNLDILVRN